MIALIKFIFKFIGVFFFVVIGLYADRLMVTPKEVMLDIFSFPWNIIILSAFVYMSAVAFSLTLKKLNKFL